MTRKLHDSYSIKLSITIVICFVVGLAALLPSARSEIVARYTFDNSILMPGYAEDSVGTADGFVNGTISLDGQAHFTGVAGSYLDLGGAGGMGTVVNTLNDTTFEMWVRANQVPTGMSLFSFGSGVTNYMNLYATTNSNPDTPSSVFESRTGASAYTNIAAVDNWDSVSQHYFAVTLSQPGGTGNVTGTLYIDGVQVAQNTNFGRLPSAMRVTTVNRLGQSQYSTGGTSNWPTEEMDDFRVWNRALSPTEIASNAASGANGISIWKKDGYADITSIANWDVDPTTGNQSLYVPRGYMTITSPQTFSNTLTVSSDPQYHGIVDVSATGNLGANTASNVIAVRGGTLILGAASNLGSNQKLLITNAGIVSMAFAPTQAFVNQTDASSDGVLAIGANTSVDLSFNNKLSLGSTGFFSYGGNITPNSSDNTYRLGGGGGSLTFSSNLVDNGLTKRALVVGITGSGGTVELSGTGSNFSGGTTITTGTLQLDAGVSLGANVAGNDITLATGTFLNLGDSNNIRSNQILTNNGGSVSILGFNPNVSGVVLNGGSITGTGGAITSATAFDVRSGTVSAILAGTAGLSKTTTGVATLSSSNTYTGGTTISAGTLAVDATGNLGNDVALNDITVDATGTLNLSAAANLGSNQKVTINNGGVVVTGLSFGAGEVQGLLAKTTSTPNSTGVLALSADTSDNLTFTNDVSLGAANGATVYYNGTTITPNAGNYRLGGGGGTINVATVLSGANALVVGGGGTPGTVILTNVLPNTYSLGTMFTSGLLSVDSVNDKLGSGGLTFSGGGLQVTNNTLSPDLGTRTLTWGTGGGTLNIADTANSFTLSAAQVQSITSTSNQLTKAGAGTLILTTPGTAQTGTPITTVTGGILQFASETALGAAPAALVANQLTLNGGGIQPAAAITSLSANRGITLGTNGGTVYLNDGASLTLPKIAGTGSLTLAPVAGGLMTGGTVTLPTGSSFTGRTILTAGTLNISNDTSLGGAPGAYTANQLEMYGGTTLAVTDNVTFATNRGLTLDAGDTTIRITSTKTLALGSSTQLAGAAGTSLTVTGPVGQTTAGTLSLGSGGSFAGKTIVTSGATVSMSTDGLGANPGTLTPDQLTLDNGTLATTANITLYANRGVAIGDGSGTIKVGANTTLIIPGGIGSIGAGTGNLLLTGTGTLRSSTTANPAVAIANTYTGRAILTAGTLSIMDQTSLGTAPVTFVPNKLELNGGTLQTTADMTIGDTSLDANSINRGITLTANSTINVNNNTTLTIINRISGTTGNLTKAGSGTLVLNSTNPINTNGVNSYTGGTTITGGLINFTDLSDLGTNGVTFNGGGVQWVAGYLSGDLSSRTLTFTGAAVLDTNTNDITLANPIGNSGAGSLTKNGVGTLTLNAANTYTGLTTVSAGTVKLGNSGAIGTSTGGLTVSGGTVDLFGFSPTKSAVVLTSGTISDTGASLGTLTSTAAYDLRAGTISAKLAGTAGLNKTTTATVTLSGANTYTGGSIISAGNLYMDVAGTLGSPIAGNNVTINSGGVLTLTNPINIGSAQTLTVNSGGVVAVSSTYGTVASLLAGMGSSSTGGVAIASNNSELLTFGSSLSFGASEAVEYTGTITPFNNIYKLGGGGGTLTFTSNLVDFGATKRSLVAGGPGLSGTVALNSPGNTYSGGTSVESGILQVNAISNLGANVLGNDVVVNGGSLTLTDPGNLGDKQLLTVNAAGTVAAASTFGLIQNLITRVTAGSTGGIALAGDSSENLNFSGNVLSLGTVGAATYSGTITPNSNTYRFGGGGGTLTVTSNLTGTGRSVVVGAASGGVTLLSPLTGNTYTGGTTVNSGTLQIGNGSAIPTTSVLTVNGGTMDFAGFWSTLAGFTITGGTATDSMGGGAYISSATTFNIQGGRVEVNLNDYMDPVTYLIVPTGLTKSGTGTATLTGSNIYSGPTKISGGILSVDSIATGLTPSNIGMSSNDPTNLILDGGTLQFTGLATTSDRGFTITQNGGTIRGTNTGAATGYGLNLTGDVINTGPGDRTLTYFSDSTGNNCALGGIIGDSASGGKLSLVKTGVGYLWLNRTTASSFKTYTGDTRIENGVIRLGGGDMLPYGLGKGNLFIGATAALYMQNNSTSINGLNGDSGARIAQVGHNTRTLTIGNGNANGDYSGSIGENSTNQDYSDRAMLVNKVGTGEQILRGISYWGAGITAGQIPIQLNGGTLTAVTLANGGQPSSIGSAPVLSGTVPAMSFSNATLKYIGAAVSTDRLFTVYSAGGALDASGTGPMNWTNVGTIIMGAAAAPRTFTLTGTNTDANTFNPVIGNYNTANPTSLAKSGVGKWILAGTKTYTGTTTINDGILELASTGQLATASAISTAAATATFQVNGGTHTLGNISGVGTTKLLTGSAVTASSIAQDVLDIGSGATFTIAPVASGALSGAGSLTAVPEPSTWAMLMLAAMGLGMYWRRSR